LIRRLSEVSRLTLRTSDTTIIGGRAAANLSIFNSDFDDKSQPICPTFICLGTAITFSAYLLHRGRVIESSKASSFFNTLQTDEAKKFIAGELLI